MYDAKMLEKKFVFTLKIFVISLSTIPPVAPYYFLRRFSQIHKMRGWLYVDLSGEGKWALIDKHCPHSFICMSIFILHHQFEMKMRRVSRIVQVTSNVKFSTWVFFCIDNIYRGESLGNYLSARVRFTFLKWILYRRIEWGRRQWNFAMMRWVFQKIIYFHCQTESRRTYNNFYYIN